MAGGPVIEHRRAHVAYEIDPRRAAADVFVRGVDEPDADVIPGAGPSISRQLIHLGTITVFVLDRVLIDAGGQNPLLLGMNDDPGPQIPVVNHLHIAIGIDRQPVEHGVHLVDEPAFALARGRITRQVRINAVSVKAAEPALEGVTHLDVHPPGHALYRYLGAIPSVFRRVDGHRRCHLAAGQLLPAFAATQGLDPFVNQGRQFARLLQDRQLDDPVIQRPGFASITEGHRGGNGGFGDNRVGAGGERGRRNRGGPRAALIFAGGFS